MRLAWIGLSLLEGRRSAIKRECFQWRRGEERRGQTQNSHNTFRSARFGVYSDGEARSAFSRVGEDEVHVSVSQGEDSYVCTVNSNKRKTGEKGSDVLSSLWRASERLQQLCLQFIRVDFTTLAQTCISIYLLILQHSEHAGYLGGAMRLFLPAALASRSISRDSPSSKKQVQNFAPRGHKLPGNRQLRFNISQIRHF